MARRNGLLDFEAMIGTGENPKGFTAQTPTGTRHMKERKAWGPGTGPDYPPIAEEGAWGRSPLKKPETDELPMVSHRLTRP
jgi:hypothetical protein